MINIIYKGVKPSRATAESAGHDLQSVENALLYPGEMRMISTGLTTAMPSDVVGLVFLRSGCARKGLDLLNRVAVIDADYRGVWQLMIRNNGSEPYRITEGDRLAQVVFLHYLTANFVPGNPADSERGEGGFGSTGK